MKKYKISENVLLFLLTLFFCLSLITTQVNAASCSGSTMGDCPTGEACSCNQTNWQNCTDFQQNCSASELQCHCVTKPDDQVACNHTICPAGYVCKGSGATSWCEKQTAGGGSECPWSQSNCPPGTVIDLSQPLNKFPAAYTRCPAPGTAQRETGVCTYMTAGTKGVCGDWYDCPTANNPDKMCRDCTEGEEGFCASREIQNYGCKSIITPTVVKPSLTPMRPTLTPTPPPTKIPTLVPLKCESLKGQVGGVVISSTNSSSVKYGDKIIFTATTNSSTQLVKSMTFQVSLIDESGAVKILSTQDMPARSENGVWIAQYEYLFSTYGKIRVQITTITPQ